MRLIWQIPALIAVGIIGAVVLNFVLMGIAFCFVVAREFVFELFRLLTKRKRHVA